MSMPIQGIQGTAAGPTAVTPTIRGTGDGFGRLVDHFLGAASNAQHKADASIMDLATGRTDDVHQVMLATAQADLMLRLVLEMRNRLTEAYQEIMRMQV